jgi:hypothetical protein
VELATRGAPKTRATVIRLRDHLAAGDMRLIEHEPIEPFVVAV